MNPLTPEDLLKFNEFVSRVPIDITSDGHWIAYNTQNREEYEGGGGDAAYSERGVMIEMAYATVWVTNTRTGEHRNLTPEWGSSWAPRWSPDGTRLAFFSDQVGQPHLFIWNRESDDMQVFSSATVRTFFGFEVPKWTPDGRFVLFKSVSSADVPLYDESVQDGPQVSPKVSPEPSFVEIWDWPKRYLQEGEDEAAQENGQREGNQQGIEVLDLVIADTKTGKTFALIKESTVRSFDIAPNGEQVAVMVGLGYETSTSQQPVYDLYVVPLPKGVHETSSTEIEPLIRRVRLEFGITLSWSPDSKRIAYTTGGQMGKLVSGNAYVVDLETDIVRNLTESLDVDLTHPYRPPLWIGESEALLCIANGEIWKVPLNDGAIRNLTENFEFSAHDVFYPSEGYTPWMVDNAITINTYDHGFYRLSLTDETIALLHKDENRNVHASRFHQDVAEETGEFI